VCVSVNNGHRRNNHGKEASLSQSSACFTNILKSNDERFDSLLMPGHTGARPGMLSCANLYFKRCAEPLLEHSMSAL